MFHLTNKSNRQSRRSVNCQRQSSRNISRLWSPGFLSPVSQGTSYAHRLILLLSILVMGMGQMWADTTHTWTMATSTDTDVKAYFTTTGSSKDLSSDGYGNDSYTPTGGSAISSGLKIDSKGQLTFTTTSTTKITIAAEVKGGSSTDYIYVTEGSTKTKKTVIGTATEVTYSGSAGSYTISKGSSEAILLYVKVEETSDVTLTTFAWSKSSDEITVGDSYTSPTFNAESSGGTVDNATAATFSSSNTSLATVAEDGTVSLVSGATGTATITATANSGYSATAQTYTVTVNAATVNYDVKFYTDNGTTQYGETQSVESNKYATEPKTTAPTKDGYTFVGWSTTYGGTAVTVSDQTITAATNFYACWSENPSASTTTTWDFKAFSSAKISSDIADYNGLKIVFNGGNTADNVSKSGVYFNGASKTTIRYIEYKPASAGKLTVTFKSNNSSEASKRSAYIGTTLASTESGSYTATATASTGTVSADLTAGTTYYIYVGAGITITKLEYVIPTAYTVTFNAGSNGTCTTTSLAESSAGAGVTLPSATANTGYTFAGWATTEGAATADAGEANATYKPSANCTLYAVYTANSYAITYKDQDNADFSGTHEASYPTTHTYGIATTLDTPTKSGYTFEGYFTTSDCSGTAVTTLAADGYSADITLYAKWAATLSSISVKTAPTKVTYTAGEAFDPTGLVITKTMSDASTSDVAYADETESFTFSPTTSTALTASNTSVTITYGGKSVEQTITVNKVASDLALTSSYTGADNAWTPAAGATIDLTKIVSSSSTGAYSISSGDAATLSGTTLTAVSNGTVTLTQAADDTYEAGSVDITVRMGTNVSNTSSKTYAIAKDDIVSDGMTVAIQNVVMTYGTDGFWSMGAKDGTEQGCYVGGQNNPSPDEGNVPTSGTYYKFVPTQNGTLNVTAKIGASKKIYVLEDGTAIAATANGTAVGKGETLSAQYSGNVTFDVTADKTYYIYTSGSKMALYGFSFEPEDDSEVTINYAKKTSNTAAGYTVSGSDGNALEAFYYGSNATADNIYYAGTANVTYTVNTPANKKVTGVVLHLFADNNSVKTQKLTFNGGEAESVKLAARKDNTTPTTVTKSSLSITESFTFSIDYDNAFELVLTTEDYTAQTTTVTLSQDGATTTGTESITATYDYAMPDITVPTRYRYVFQGYYDAETGGTQYYNADGTSAKKWDKTDATATLYAQWKEWEGWYIEGSFEDGDSWTTKYWPTDGSVSINLPAANTNYKFQVCLVKGLTETWYGLSGSTSYMTSDNCTAWNFVTDNKANCGITSTTAGSYVFSVNTSGSNPTVSVTYPAAVSSIKLDNSYGSMYVGGPTLTLTPTVAPDNASDKTVTWTSSDATIATVSEAGVVTAVAAGDATITATANDGSGVTSTCKVTVNADADHGNIFTMAVKTGIQLETASQTSYYLNSDYVTAAGGGVSIKNGNKEKSAVLVKNGGITLNSSSDTYLKLDLKTPLAAGDVIIFKGITSGSKTASYCQVIINANGSSKTTAITTAAGANTYTVKTGDAIVGSSTVYFLKKGGAAFKGLTIARPFAITYNPSTYDATNHGYITGAASAIADSTVTITVNDDKGYAIQSLTATDGAGNNVTLTGRTFTMPVNTVTVTATFNYKVSFVSDHGTTPDSIGATSVTLPHLTDTGYYNYGWTADKAFTGYAAGATIPCGTALTITEATTFTALWDEAIEILPTDGGLPEGYEFMSSNGEIQTVTQEGYTMKGKTVVYIPNNSTTKGLVIPDYATVKRIVIKGTSANETAAGIKISGTDYADTYMDTPKRTDAEEEMVFTVTTPAQSQDFTFTMWGGLYATIELYGEEVGHPKAPTMSYDYATNQMTISLAADAEEGTMIYYGESIDDVNNKTYPYTGPFTVGKETVIYAAAHKNVFSTKVSKQIYYYEKSDKGYYIVSTANELKSALNYANELTNAGIATAAAPSKIFVEEGPYDLGTAYCTVVPGHTALLGADMDGVIIKNAKSGGSSNTATLQAKGDGVYIQNLTLTNTASGAQAAAFEDAGTSTILKHVKLLGYQDTYYSRNTKVHSLVEDCYIEGHTDFICGSGDVFFHNCTLNVTDDGDNAPNICAPANPYNETGKGFVFNGCTITGTSGYTLARPWNDNESKIMARAEFVNVTFEATPSTEGWATMEGTPKLFSLVGCKDGSDKTVSNSSFTFPGADDWDAANSSWNAAITATDYDQDDVLGTTVAWNDIVGTYTQDVTVGSTGFATIGMPFATKLPDGVKGYYVTSLNNRKIYAKELASGTIVAANTGLITTSLRGKYSYFDMADGNSYTPNYLKATGATAKQATKAGEFYVLAVLSTDAETKKSQLGFKKISATGKCGAYKAYIDASDVPSVSGAKPSSLVFSLDEDIPTDVEVEEAETLNVDGPAYNTAGQRVKANTKGILIINGHKYYNK